MLGIGAWSHNVRILLAVSAEELRVPLRSASPVGHGRQAQLKRSVAMKQPRPLSNHCLTFSQMKSPDDRLSIIPTWISVLLPGRFGVRKKSG
jgi:hypothetical protein